MRKNILITGAPKSGKSTLLKGLISSYQKKTGFITHEIVQDNQRVGFEIETHTGKKSMLAHIDFPSWHTVGKYFVHISHLEQLIPEVSTFAEDDLLYLDEIAEMELYSDAFKELVVKYLDAPNICIALISQVYDDAFTEFIKHRDDTMLIEITPDNRIAQRTFVESLLRKISKAKKYSSEPERVSFSTHEVLLRSEHSTRQLVKQGNEWTCNCDFFEAHRICSHLLALEELMKNRTFSSAI